MRDLVKGYGSYLAAGGLLIAALWCLAQGDLVHAQAYGAAALGLVGVHLHVSDGKDPNDDDEPPPAPRLRIAS